MPFKEFKVVETVQKKCESKTFNSSYVEVEKEYELIKRVVEARKSKLNQN